MDEIELTAKNKSKTHKEEHYAVDFDGVCAEYSSWEEQENKVGKPIKPMINQIKKWLKKGIKISIFTARLSHGAVESEKQIALIQKFLKDNGLPETLPITCIKSYWFTKFFDDRAYRVISNTGIIEGNTGL
jgi:hypothetical protein